MKKLSAFVVTLTFITTLAGCAGTARQDERVGFYHRKVTDSVYVIGFTGNERKITSRTNDFALLLAAEIGRQLGYTSFVVSGRPGNIWNPRLSGVQARGAGTLNRPVESRAHRLEMQVTYSKTSPGGNRANVLMISDVLRKMKNRYNVTL